MTMTLAVLLAMIAVANPPEGESNWPGWRGPTANGHSVEGDLPVKWTPNSVIWKTPLKGWGQSSPVIWGDKILLTTALEKGRTRIVFCVDRNTGKILWEKVAWTGEPERSHNMNGWASATCVTDGERVYAFFGRGGLHCYSLDGKPIWSKNLGRFESPWGTAACPVLVGDLLIQNCDADTDAQLFAFDKKTGRIVWKVKRENHRGWSTPIVIQAGGRQELILNGHTGVSAYDCKTGKMLWFCKSARGRGTPTVTPGNNLLYVINGLSGNGFYAIKH